MTDKRAPSSLAAYGRRDGPVTPEVPTRFSYDHASRAEPATIGALLNATNSPERPLAFSDDELLPRFHLKARGPGQSSGLNAGRARRVRRTQKAQPGGAFLLQDAVAGDDDNNQSRRRNRSQQRPKEGSDPLSTSAPRDFGLGVNAGGSRNRTRIVSPDTSQEELFVKRRDGHARRPRASHQASTALDVDSTQIVNMALNLSESRRIASRRNITRTNPPRLAPVQDAPAGSNLKTHLQQQRKTTRNISPIPAQALTPRLSGVRSSSPLRPPFDAGNENPYRYHFSTSTLARAQKAREHLELMSQYRRLLEVLPPLKLGPDRPSASSPPSSPINGKLSKFGSAEPLISGGREYNPLQYIRNRKVRARERLVIDGDVQGFSDVESVKSWVEKASQRASTLNILSGDGSSILPPFPSADEIESQPSLDSAPKSGLRSRRPRVDWFFEPCDMIADAYWVERDHHKQLIEDRNWHKIFPEGAVLSRPMSRQTDELGTGVTPFPNNTLEDAEWRRDSKELRLMRPDTDQSQGSTKERAKQKLHDIGGGFHRHTASAHSHHLRIRKDSFSDSGSDNEVKSEGKPKRSRQTRAGTISSHTNDLLEKQMLEMIAQEAKQRLSHVTENDAEYMQAGSSTTPEHSLFSKQTSNRKWSLTDPSDSDRPSLREKAQMESLPGYQLEKFDTGTSRRKRHGLDDIDSPQAVSPELNPVPYSLPGPPTGLQLSAPSSRSSSPSRNPFSKVKRALRDKGRDDSSEPQQGDAEDSDHRSSFPESTSLSQGRTWPERLPSTSRPAHEGQKHHRSTSVRHRRDDEVGLRGMFKGPRIDTVIRGSVSRLGDMLWKKDSAFETPSEAFSDDSENEQARGRARLSLSLSRSNSRRNNEVQHNPKHFLDTMPQFQPVSEVYGRSTTTDHRLAPESGIHSAKSSRLNLSGLEVPNKVPSVPHRTVDEVLAANAEASESESCRESAPDSSRAGDKMPKSVTPVVRFSEPDNFRSRKWSIVDQAQPRECQVSKREIARLRTLILASGIKAMEISRRAQEAKRPLAKGSLLSPGRSTRSNIAGVPWAEIAKLTPKASLPSDQEIPYCDHYPLASETLSIAIETEVERWQMSSDRFTGQTRPKLEERLWCVRSRIADELSGMTGEAADQADETGKDLALGQLLKIKRVVDLIEELSRNRRRRFRWLRRGMWSVVEWVLVGFMWYVWFVVTILRILLGLGQGTWSGIRWLLWL
ncbi:hypothetical protein B0J13DRAFT_545790 [Dactylonectria estremocensis]|uniref:Uncharacterized protein n=1 Tax=Dactylonectria estremocensis TaxID=1079267 RepID=A0A9P9F4V1_9HYPO|nr:hypothetical protein B0J13DRAFT_545790 [Dactylonectria estremocensis]